MLRGSDYVPHWVPNAWALMTALGAQSMQDWELGGQPSKKAVMSAEFVAAEMPAAQSETDHVASCSSSRDSHGEFDLMVLVAVPQIGKWFSLSCALVALF